MTLYANFIGIQDGGSDQKSYDGLDINKNAIVKTPELSCDRLNRLGSPLERCTNIFVRIRFNVGALVCLALPFFGLIACTALGLYKGSYDQVICKKHGEWITFTQFWPSICKVTNNAPMVYIWHMCIGLHASPRFGATLAYYNLFMNGIHNVPARWRTWYRAATKLNFLLNVIEIVTLMITAFISPLESFIHNITFTIFAFAVIIYGPLFTLLYTISRPKYMSQDEKKSLRFKYLSLMSMMGAVFGLVFFFLYHVGFCADGAYSKFAMCEYWLAFSNMAFHFTAYWDFKNSEMRLAKWSHVS